MISQNWPDGAALALRAPSPTLRPSKPSRKYKETSVPTTPADLDQLCINTIRCLSIDAVQKANSGHPGAPMGQAPMGHVIWSRHLRHNPANPNWPGRDRFILSPGHGCMLLYSL